MSRRIVPGIFWAGILVCALLLLLDGTMKALGQSHSPRVVKGIWDGFFLAADGTLGSLQSDITLQNVGRRLVADSVLIDLETGTRYNTCNFCFPPPRADFIAGTGVTQTGRLVFQAGLESYAPQPPVVAFQTSLEPRAGDGAVMYPEFHFVPSHGGASRASALLLNPFITIDAPDIAGSYEGPFLSLADPVTGAPADPTFRGIGRMPILPRNARGTYAGQVQLYFDPNSDPFISWPFLATASDDGRVIWVAQGKAGRIIYDGVVVPAPDMTVERLDGIFRLFLNEGRTLYNSYNCPISGVIQ